MRTGDLRSLHSKAHVSSIIGKAKEWYGDRCANCGSTDEVEWHHIVPLRAGGKNVAWNVVPLCRDCHHAVHYGTRLDKYKPSHGGRPRKAITAEQRTAFVDYVYGKIPKTEACRLIGVNRIDQNRPPYWMREVMDEIGIDRFKNNVEVMLVNHGMVGKGAVTGWILEKGCTRKRACRASVALHAEEFGLTRRGETA